MVKKLLSKLKFSQLAGVTPAAVTKACGSSLKPALVGKRIDPDHPSAVEYVRRQELARTPPAAPGLDPLYNEAVRVCTEKKRWSGNLLTKELRISSKRAAEILAQLKAAGLVPEKGKPARKTATVESTPPPPPDPPPEPKAPHVRGTAARKQARKEAAGEDPILEVPENIAAFLDMSLRDLITRFGTDERFVDWLNATQKIEIIEEKRIKNAEKKGELVSRSLVKNGLLDHVESAHLQLLSDGAKTIARRSVALHDAGRDQVEIEKFIRDQISSHIRPMKAKIARALKNA